MNDVLSEPDWAGIKAEAFGFWPINFGCRMESLAALSGQLVYLATPYSREVVTDGRYDPLKAEGAAQMAARWSVALARRGVTAVSPIVQAQAMVGASDLALDPLDASFWERWCAPLLRRCDAVVVPPIEGWDRSLGIWHEVMMALRRNRRVVVLGGDLAGAV